MSGIRQLATSRQLAFELFAAAAEEKKRPIDTASSDVGFVRNNLLIRIVDLGLAARRLIDAAYFIVAQSDSDQLLYDEDLGYFKWLMRYAGGSNAHLRQIITEAQKALIQVTGTTGPEDDRPFGSTQLIGRISFEDGRIQFRVPPEMVTLIRGPQKSHWLSLRVTTQFNTTYARVLYDHLVPLATEDEVVTDYYSLDELRSWLDGEHTTTVEYKYFNRDYLEPAIRQINQLSHIEISRLRSDTRNSPGSRKVGFVRFRLKRKSILETPFLSLEESASIYRSLCEKVGLNHDDLHMIEQDRKTYTTERIQSALDYTLAKAKKGDLRNARGYFLNALKAGRKLSEFDLINMEAQQSLDLSSEQEVTVKAEARKKAERFTALQETSQQMIADERRHSEANQGIELYRAASADRQTEWFGTFIRSSLTSWVLKRHGVNTGTVTAEDLLERRELRDAFGQHVFEKAKAEARMTK
ncbi:replication initiation protein [Paraburkholderia unamae]|uniref:Replication initiation protein n=1 Tax=Paraburkholderia unamae TaxID=219649 RepID=A0ACC6RWU6_9BURK